MGTLNKALCGTNVEDSAPDVFWRADDPGAGQATAIVANSAANARSTAVLALPAGAVVTHARLYWAGQLATNTPDATVTLSRRAPGAFTTPITADTSYSVLKTGTTDVYWYESSADVTTLVQTQGIGGYRVSGIDSVNLVNLDSPDPFVAWSLVVFYRLDTDPERNLTLYDGLDLVAPGSTVTVPLSGFLVPSTGWDAKLGVLAYEGDFVFTGDSLLFDNHTHHRRRKPRRQLLQRFTIVARHSREQRRRPAADGRQCGQHERARSRRRRHHALRGAFSNLGHHPGLERGRHVHDRRLCHVDRHLPAQLRHHAKDVHRFERRLAGGRRHRAIHDRRDQYRQRHRPQGRGP